MIDKRNKTKILLYGIEVDVMTSASAKVSDAESNAIEKILQRSNNNLEEKLHPCWKSTPQDTDEISSIFADILQLLDDQVLYELIKSRSDLGKFQVLIGSTKVSKDEFLVHGDDDSTTVTVDMVEQDDEKILDKLFVMTTKGAINLDEIMVSATQEKVSQNELPLHIYQGSGEYISNMQSAHLK